MADTKITALAAITTVDPAADVLPIVDVSDTSMAASGTTKKITSNQILGAGGTATLASATITGDLTVDTSTLKVDSTNNRVGIGTASPTDTLDVNGRVTAARFLSSSSSASLPALAVSAGNGVYNSGTNEVGFSVNSTLAMTLNSTGLGVGVASPAFKIHANGVIGTTNTFGAFTALQTAGGTGYRWTLANDNNFYLQYSPDAFGSTATSRIALDSSGNVGVGVTPSAWGSGFKYIQAGPGCAYGTNGSVDRTDLAANWYYNGGDKYINATGKASVFQQSGGAFFWLNTNTASGGAGSACSLSTAMTLDASGNLLVGTTSSLAGSAHSFKATGTTSSFWAVAFKHEGTTANGRLQSWSIPNANDTGSYFVYASNSSGNCFNVLGNGNVQNTSGTYGTISDLRLKENISDARNYLADLLKLRVVKYSLKSEASAVATKIGLIAQEVEQVFPTLVETNSDEVKSIKTTVLIPMLLKAIQELTARVAALEA